MTVEAGNWETVTVACEGTDRALAGGWVATNPEDDQPAAIYMATSRAIDDGSVWEFVVTPDTIDVDITFEVTCVGNLPGDDPGDEPEE